LAFGLRVWYCSGYGFFRGFRYSSCFRLAILYQFLSLKPHSWWDLRHKKIERRSGNLVLRFQFRFRLRSHHQYVHGLHHWRSHRGARGSRGHFLPLKTYISHSVTQKMLKCTQTLHLYITISDDFRGDGEHSPLLSQIFSWCGWDSSSQTLLLKCSRPYIPILATPLVPAIFHGGRGVISTSHGRLRLLHDGKNNILS